MTDFFDNRSQKLIKIFNDNFQEKKKCMPKIQDLVAGGKL